MTDEDFPRFPPVSPVLLAEGALPEIVEAFCESVQRWRREAVEWLTRDQESSTVSPSLARIVLWSLGAERTPGEMSPAYRLAVFPDLPGPDDTGGPRRTREECGLKILVWRSRIVDFLADAWDTIGPDSFTPQECGRIIEVFSVEKRKGSVRCIDCLQSLSSDFEERRRHTRECSIRLRRLAEDKAAGAAWANSPFD